jgi:predicted dehydrogenase/threonine dehydrogenase-like Zn-dependent dehydrogenase
MKQLLLRKGKVGIEEVPYPARHPYNLLVEVSRSLISTGTERTSVESSQSSLIEKALKKPAAISKAIQSIRVRGVMKTLALAQGQLDQSTPLGYSCCGRVLAVGEGVPSFRAGDRVACAGAGLANHAEVVSVPANLCVKVPAGVSDRAASFMTVGGIALQGVRRADARLGETVSVIGLGLIGQLTVQLLAAAGCNVLGMDLDPIRVKQALKSGMLAGASSSEEFANTVRLSTNQKGADATILTASTGSSEPTQLAFEITRKKGKIVVVGAVGLNLKRSPFYEKEQDLLISCSYGPGRYDPAYEKEGRDYPYAYVRWTENRNMAAFLEMIEHRRIDVEALIDREVHLDEVTAAYEELGKKDGPKPLAVVIAYPEAKPERRQAAPLIKRAAPPSTPGRIRLGLIGAGAFMKSTHLPNLEKLKDQVQTVGVCTATGATATTMGRQLDASLVTNDYQEILNSAEVDAVLISTRHNTHAKIAEAALKSGKHVYLEKPLALTLEELESLDRTVRGLDPCPVFMVGFNRRYSPFALRLSQAFARRQSPLLISYRVNAGMLPETHWSLTEEGGGRLRGEACHMVDLFRFLVNQPLAGYDLEAIRATSGLRPDENFQARFTYADGSLCTLVYTSMGNKDLPKEWAECHWDGKSAVMEDFKTLRFYGQTGDQALPHQDKGHAEALKRFVSAIATRDPFPTPWEQVFETTRATIELDREVRGRLPV